MENDTMLLIAARRMNADALETVFNLYAEALYRYAFRFCENALVADETVGDVFSKLLEQFAAGNGPTDNLRSYLFEMTYHLLVDQTRYAQRRVTMDAVTLTLRDGYSVYAAVENRLMLETALQTIKKDLTDYQRHVIFLRFFEGFSLCETGSILGKSAKDIKAAQNRAIVKLRRALDGISEDIRTVEMSVAA
jgi:RNA polymerase sigma-70 factor, ECF subfamily